MVQIFFIKKQKLNLKLAEYKHSMKFTHWFKAIVLLLNIFLTQAVQIASAQSEVQLEYSNTPLRLDQVFKITISTGSERLKSISNFPEIEDFVKGKTIFIKAKKNHVIEQEYLPLKAGKYILQPFNLIVNGKKFSFNGKVVVVNALKGKTVRNGIIEEPAEKNGPEVIPDALLQVKSDKSSVYSGEGFSVTAAFCIAKNNTVEYNFVDIKAQVSKMILKLKPAHCWIEESNIPPMSSVDSILIDDNVYFQYQIYAANFYPFDTVPIRIPSMDFKILNYKLNRTPLSIERQAFYLKLSSVPYTIQVKSLPPNPYKERVAVGVFSFEEKLSTRKTKMGEMFKYYFTIKNKNGLSTTIPPFIFEGKDLEIFTPRINVKKYTDKGEVLNGKTYEYPIIARTAGKISLKEHFYWIYFNTGSKQYDTILPKLSMEIQSGSQPEDIQLTIHENFYHQMISKVSNDMRSKEKDDRIKLISNILIVFMLISTFILILKK